ncbi:Transcriptional regulator of yeast-form-adherence 3 [Candida viswanathii]|uniref:Transcriptional regulator of yeast-form-adherence 3 n=1 Tax=Candida viswanathii TaxID=5486 RepID=A0A367YGB5_9ASCO|nr:Transcriptional regulator of yeast-form-adherence 3 [Candida viswanathii]
MKFAKTLERTLEQDEIPQQWIEAAIQYKALKKCINKVVTELEFLGLQKNTLKLLLNDKVVEMNDSETSPGNPIIAEYILSKTDPDSHNIKPMLKITLDYSNEDISHDHIVELGKELKLKLESFLNSDDEDLDDDNRFIELKEGDGGDLTIVQSRENSLSPPSSPPVSPLLKVTEVPNNNIDEALLTPVDNHKKHEVYIMLNSDSKFFDMLDEELNSLDMLRKEEENKIIDEVKDLAKKVQGFKSKQSELYKWRELFKIYLDSEVYFKYNDTDLASQQRNSLQIKQNLDLFVTNMKNAGVMTKFNKKSSMAAFNEFMEMNYHLLKLLQFQTINNEALRKILKKFDKQTSLGIQNTFPQLISNDHIFMSGKSLAQSICYIVQESVINVIPQLDDYSCPICMEIAYKPIRLSCGHLFCVRCLVKLKKDDKTSCPLCRAENAILYADSSNLDLESMELMKKYFPREVKEKIRDRDKERYNELRGNAKGEKCVIM